jgi:hypothetical protein
MKIKGYLGRDLVAEGSLDATQSKKTTEGAPLFRLDLGSCLKKQELKFLPYYNFKK